MIDSVGQPNLGSALAEAAQNTAQAHLDLMKRLLHEFARGQHRGVSLKRLRLPIFGSSDVPLNRRPNPLQTGQLGFLFGIEFFSWFANWAGLASKIEPQRVQ